MYLNYKRNKKMKIVLFYNIIVLFFAKINNLIVILINEIIKVYVKFPKAHP